MSVELWLRLGLRMKVTRWSKNVETDKLLTILCMGKTLGSSFDKDKTKKAVHSTHRMTRFSATKHPTLLPIPPSSCNSQK